MIQLKQNNSKWEIHLQERWLFDTLETCVEKLKLLLGYGYSCSITYFKEKYVVAISSGASFNDIAAFKKALEKIIEMKREYGDVLQKLGELPSDGQAKR